MVTLSLVKISISLFNELILFNGLISKTTLWWNIKSLCSHVNYLISVNTWNYKEDPRTSSSSCQESTKSEDNSSLKLLDNFYYKDKREGKSDENDDDSNDSQQSGTCYWSFSFTTLTKKFRKVILKSCTNPYLHQNSYVSDIH